MKKMTETNLKDAFSGESQAHMKYLIFAMKAEDEGKPNIARLFRAISYAEQVHAANHLRILDGVGSTAENLQTAIDGENFEVDEMYPAYDAVARLQEEKGAIRSIHYAIEAEKIHAAMYGEARQSVEKGTDLNLGKVQICPVCGYTIEGEAPDNCPVCGVTKEKFVIF
ncbi:MAG TPA: rubrerythrin family protein [bacterium]|nr:rubrerythrin family protein [bacterium]